MRRTIGLLRLIVLMVLIAPIGLMGCTRYDLELYDDGRADVHFTFDWMTRYGERPEGMTFMWSRDNDTITYYDPTYLVDERTEKLPSGTYYVTTMNKTFGEYGTMNFYRRNSHNDIYAKALTYNINVEAWDKGHVYLTEPELIGVATDTIVVPKNIDDLVFRDYREPSTVEDIHLECPQTILPMTTTLNIRVKVRGISYMQSMEGYITGLATGFWLNRRWRLTEVGNMRLTNWERVSGSSENALLMQEAETESNVGWMKTSVQTFGLPHGKELLRWRTPNDNYILLHFTLIDGRKIDFGYPVGLNIRYEGDNGLADIFTQSDVTLELDLVIDAPFYENDEVPLMPYSQPSGSGQFDADVQPWGDDVDVEIPI